MHSEHKKQVFPKARSHWQLNRRRFLSAGVGSIFAASLTAAERPQHAEKPVASDHVRLGLRVWRPIWLDSDVFTRLLDTLDSFPAAVDELALFDEFVHVLGRPLEEVQHEATVIQDRLERVRSSGRGAGINVIATLGHGIQGRVREMLFPPIVSHAGKPSAACICPRSPELHTYLGQYMRIMAGAGPDVIWVDDDFRTITGGVRYACFCPTCLEQFDPNTDREALVKRLDDPEETQLRKRWSKFYASALVALAEKIRDAIHAVDPNIAVGLMTVGYSLGTYADYPIPRLMSALGASRGRPGHGYYNDDRPRGIIDKAMDVGRQVRDYPRQVRWSQYELENWPYVTLDKSAATVINECTLAMMIGCNGVLANILWERARSFDELRPLLGAVAAQRPQWEEMRQAAEGLPLVGFWPADTPQLMSNRCVEEKGWFVREDDYPIQAPNSLADLGVPLTVDPKSAVGTVLAGRVAEGFSDGTLREMLSGAMLIDSEALRVLWKRGLGELTGVKPGEAERFCYERLTAHPLNGSGAGDGRRGFPHDTAIPLSAVADGVEFLSEARHQHDDQLVGPCLSIFQNEAGGRVAVTSYVPWQQLGRAAKRRQLLAVADWLSRGTLPIVIEKTVRVVPLVRQSDDGRRTVIALFNASFDATGPVRLRLRSRPDRLVFSTGERPLPIQANRSGKETHIEIPTIAPWSTAILRSVG